MPGVAEKEGDARGYKVYFLSQAKNEADKLVAMRENAVIELEDKPQNYGELKNVLIDLAGQRILAREPGSQYFARPAVRCRLRRKDPPAPGRDRPGEFLGAERGLYAVDPDRNRIHFQSVGGKNAYRKVVPEDDG